MKYIKSFEFEEKDLEPISSFKIKDELNPKVWETNDKMFDHVREQLLEIAEDFYESTDLTAEIKDIVLTGSLSNYNWSSRYSDFDLHIVVDYDEINDDTDLVDNLLYYMKNDWNRKYDIYIEGFEVEVYIENMDEPARSSGVYSILNDKWNVKPVKKKFIPDEKSIRMKAESVMTDIDNMEENFDKFNNDEFIELFDKVWKRIRRYRAEGLESEVGEFSVGNLTFKLLRRNGYIGKLLELKKTSYENKFK